jgi:capsular exopolysaccharide synthesis family protein
MLTTRDERDTKMSRIQNILDKAEREGATLRTGHMDIPGTGAAITATVPITIEIPTPPTLERSIVPGTPSSTITGQAVLPNVSTSTAAADNTIASYSVRLSSLLVAGLAPKSAAAEQYRQLRTRLAHAEGANSLRTVLVTSPQKAEGKSITSANLALTMAQELHRRVVIVEADLRKPSMQQLFGLPPGPGLTEYLSGAVELRDVMRFLPDHNLTVIYAGSAAGNPAELLGSTAMRRLLDALRTRFDRVILDTPPVLPLADVAVLAPLVDGALMVVRAGVTPKPAIENALRAFDTSRLIGIVLNDSGQEQDYRYEGTRH